MKATSHSGRSALQCAMALNFAACSLSTTPGARPPAETLAEFESQLSRLRNQLAIPRCPRL